MSTNHPAISHVYRVQIELPTVWTGKTYYTFLDDELVDANRIPAGFRTDGATIPRIAWGIFPPVCQYFPAAAVHDKALNDGEGRYRAWRKFKSALKVCGIPGWRKFIMVAFVRMYDVYAVAVKGAKP